MKLLHVVGDSRFGGVGKIILGLSRTARAEGWRVDVLTTDPVFQRAVRQHNFGLIDLEVIRREIRPLWDLSGLLRLYRFLRAESYDLIHTHTSKGGFVGRLAGRLATVPTIVHTAHGFAFHEASACSARLFYAALERLAAAWCDRIVTVSEFHRQWAIDLNMCSPGRIFAIPNGTAEPVQSLGLASHEIRRQIGAQSGDLIVLSVARLAVDKGLEHLIKAAVALPQRGTSIRIAIAGEGPDRRRLEQLARELNVTRRVTFLGFREDIGDLLAASDIVALPSLREGLSISLLEAMAAGKPIITTTIGSNKEVASKGEALYLVPPGDANSLREAILQLAQDATLARSLGKIARSVYEGYYTENRMLHSYMRLYSDLLRTNYTAQLDHRKTPQTL